jgi:hypothetical protein
MTKRIICSFATYIQTHSSLHPGLTLEFAGLGVKSQSLKVLLRNVHVTCANTGVLPGPYLSIMLAVCAAILRAFYLDKGIDSAGGGRIIPYVVAGPSVYLAQQLEGL